MPARHTKAAKQSRDDTGGEEAGGPEPDDEEGVEGQPNLEETITDPLNSTDREALTTIRQHELTLGPLREQLATFRREGGTVSLSALRQFVAEGDRVEALMGISREVLARDAIAEVEWPSRDLDKAREAIATVDACEQATEGAREELEGSSPDSGSAVGALERLLESWAALRRAETEAKGPALADSVAARLDLTMEVRSGAVSPLCDALLDKAVELHTSLAQRFASAASSGEAADTSLLGTIDVRLRAMLATPRLLDTLESLHVEVPRLTAVELPDASPVSQGDVAADLSGDGPEKGAGRSPTPATGEADPEVPKAAPGKMGRLTKAGFAASAPDLGTAGDKAAQPSTSATSSKRTGGSAAASRLARAGLGNASTPSMGMTSGDPLDMTIPAAPSVDSDAMAPAPMMEMAAPLEGSHEPTSEDPLFRTVPAVPCGSGPLGSGPLGSGTRRRPAPCGSAELWHAVHVGDEATVARFISEGTCDGLVRDASAHSVLWHAVAFGHASIAHLMLETFPPGSELGVDVGEFHQRKGDTFLHLLASNRAFDAGAAQIFKRIAAAIAEHAPALFERVNAAGHTFYEIASAGLNFWVLTFVLRNYPVQAKSLICMTKNAPLKAMAESIAQPAPPTFEPPEPFPDHFKLADMLAQDDTGMVAYADVALDVGPDAGGAAAARFLAHRVVVASQSPVLMAELEKASLTLLPSEQITAAIVRIDPNISKDVWRSVLQFMYTGVVHCSFGEDSQLMLELLRACVVYGLAKPLSDYAQCCLFPLLPRCRPQAALQAFSLASAAGAAVDLQATRDAASYIILRSAHKLFYDVDAREACKALEQVIQAVEHSVFNPSAAATEQEERKAAISQPPEQLDASMSTRTLPHVPQGPMDQSLSWSAPHALQDTMQMSRGGVPRPLGQDTLSQSVSHVGGGQQVSEAMIQQMMAEMQPQGMMPDMPSGFGAPEVQRPAVHRMQSAPAMPTTQEVQMQRLMKAQQRSMEEPTGGSTSQWQPMERMQGMGGMESTQDLQMQRAMLQQSMGGMDMQMQRAMMQQSTGGMEGTQEMQMQRAMMQQRMGGMEGTQDMHRMMQRGMGGMEGTQDMQMQRAMMQRGTGMEGTQDMQTQRAIMQQSMGGTDMQMQRAMMQQSAGGMEGTQDMQMQRAMMQQRMGGMESTQDVQRMMQRGVGGIDSTQDMQMQRAMMQQRMGGMEGTQDMQMQRAMMQRSMMQQGGMADTMQQSMSNMQNTHMQNSMQGMQAMQDPRMQDPRMMPNPSMQNHAMARQMQAQYQGQDDAYTTTAGYDRTTI